MPFMAAFCAFWAIYGSNAHVYGAQGLGVQQAFERFVRKVSSAMRLRTCYAKSGTDIAYSATSRAMHSPGLTYGVRHYQYIERVEQHGTGLSKSQLALALRSVCLRCVWYCHTVQCYQPTLCPVLPYCTVLPACAVSAYAVSGTDILYRATCLHACSAMSGTDIAYGATSLRDIRY
eukprot:1821848-Rhodomonas_salina.4